MCFWFVFMRLQVRMMLQMPNFLRDVSLNFPHEAAGIESWNTPQRSSSPSFRSPQIYFVQRTCHIIRYDFTAPVNTAWLKCTAYLPIRPFSDVHVNCRWCDKKCRFVAFCKYLTPTFIVSAAPSPRSSRPARKVHGCLCTYASAALYMDHSSVLCHLCKWGAGGMLCLLGRG